MQTLTGPEFKTCCASLYQDQLLQFLLGPSLHPGGLRSTGRLADAVRLSSDDTALDIASGLGETARFLEGKYGCKVTGVDLSRKLARQSYDAGAKEAQFLVGDAEKLPFRHDAFTTVLSECSMCLLPGFGQGLSEISRVLSPGGRLGVTDITCAGGLHPELEDVLMSFLCVTTKLPMYQYTSLAEEAGLAEVRTFDETESLRGLLEGIKKRLLLAELLSGIGKLPIPSDKLARGKRLLALAKDAVDQGHLSYFMLTGQKPKA